MKEILSPIDYLFTEYRLAKLENFCNTDNFSSSILANAFSIYTGYKSITLCKRDVLSAMHHHILS